MAGKRVAGMYAVGFLPQTINLATYGVAIGMYANSLWPQINAEKNPDGPLDKKSGAVNSNTGFFSWRHPRTINRPSATNSRITRIFCTFAITSTPHRLMAKNTLRATIRTNML